jgi:hypothetical protein
MLCRNTSVKLQECRRERNSELAGSSGLPVIVGVDLATNGSLPISELLGLCDASAVLGLYISYVRLRTSV